MWAPAGSAGARLRAFRMTPGKLLVLSAPSGAGKSSLAKALAAGATNFAVSVSHTTRAPRPGERNGTDYHFVSPEQFESMVREGRFLEYARVFVNSYGTARESVEKLLTAGKNVVLDIDWQGARRIKALMPEAVTVFVLPPSRAVLHERLQARGQDSAETIARRMQEAASEMSHYGEFDHVVVNDDFAAALADIRAILDGHFSAVRRVTLDIPALLGEE